MKKAELITFLQRPTSAPRSIPPPKPAPRLITAPRPIPALRPPPNPAPRPIPAPRSPPKPTLRPTPRPYQLKPKGGKGNSHKTSHGTRASSKPKTDQIYEEKVRYAKQEN